MRNSVLTRLISAKWLRVNFQPARRLNETMRRHRWLKPTQQMEIQANWRNANVSVRSTRDTVTGECMDGKAFCILRESLLPDGYTWMKNRGLCMKCR